MTERPVVVETAENAELTTTVLERGRRAGLAAVGVALADIQQPARSALEARKAAGYSGAMQFTYRNPTRSTDPTRHLPSARSLVVGALAYGREPMGQPPSGMPGGGRLVARVARYARDNSYELLAEALSAVAEELTSCGYRAVVVADSNHLVDRNAAWRAGLGWYGKNSNLLVPEVGSWVVLGTVVTDAELVETGPPMIDGCGRCQACITDCPTDAIVAPGIVDATRCIAWMVQAAEPIPRHLRSAVGDRIYGCDDCQDVCPVGAPDRSGQTAGSDGVVEVVDLLTASDADLMSRFGHWYIAGRDPNVIRRTALVVLANVASDRHRRIVAPILSRYLNSGSSLLVQHAIWAARRLEMIDLIPERLRHSDDEAIQSELVGLANDRPGRQHGTGHDQS